MSRTGRTLIKIAIALAALAVVGVLFVRSARSVRAEPFEVSRDRMTGWTLAIEPPDSGSGVLLSLQPQRELPGALFNQLFARTGESLSGPVPAAIPLVLRSEIDPRAAAALAPEALLSLAREAGLERATFEPRCMAHRRISAPGVNRQLYFVLFDLPAFDAFRRQVAQRLRDGGGASAFDPAVQSPALIVAATDAAFSRWLPLKADAEKECFAPITVSP
jgi:hypothetical protein